MNYLQKLLFIMICAYVSSCTTVTDLIISEELGVARGTALTTISAGVIYECEITMESGTFFQAAKKAKKACLKPAENQYEYDTVIRYLPVESALRFDRLFEVNSVDWVTYQLEVTEINHPELPSYYLNTII